MGYKPRLQTKSDLQQYILRKLGSPVIQIEITGEQLDDCIDDVLEYYMQRAYSGVIEKYVPIKLIKGISQIQLPYEVFAVTEVLSSGIGQSGGSAGNMFSINQYIASDLYRGSGKIDILTYSLTNQMLATLETVFTKKITFDYNCINRVLSLFEIPVQDENVILHIYQKNVPTYEPNPLFGLAPDQTEEIEHTNIYSELIVRKLATEYARRQWGYNLVKYEGSSLPNGLTLNASRIIDEANTNILKLEEEFESQYILPTDFYFA